MAEASNEETLNECCLKEYRPLPGTPSGQLVNIAGLKTYHSSSANGASKDKAIVLLTDVFGE